MSRIQRKASILTRKGLASHHSHLPNKETQKPMTLSGYVRELSSWDELYPKPGGIRDSRAHGLP